MLTFSNAEHSNAKVIAGTLHIPLTVLNTPTSDEFDSTLLHVLEPNS